MGDQWTEMSVPRRLWDAVLEGDVAAVRRLVARGADTHAKTQDGDTALHVASQIGHVEVQGWVTEEWGFGWTMHFPDSVLRISEI